MLTETVVKLVKAMQEIDSCRDAILVARDAIQETMAEADGYEKDCLAEVYDTVTEGTDCLQAALDQTPEWLTAPPDSGDPDKPTDETADNAVLRIGRAVDALKESETQASIADLTLRLMESDRIVPVSMHDWGDRILLSSGQLQTIRKELDKLRKFIQINATPEGFLPGMALDRISAMYEGNSHD